jgi:hypothetical protein
MMLTLADIENTKRINYAIGFARGRLKAARDLNLISLEEAVDDAIKALDEPFWNSGEARRELDFNPPTEDEGIDILWTRP